MTDAGEIARLRGLMAKATAALTRSEADEAPRVDQIKAIAEAIWIGETQLKTDYPPKGSFADEPDRDRYLWLGRYVDRLVLTADEAPVGTVLVPRDVFNRELEKSRDYPLSVGLAVRTTLCALQIASKP